MLCQLEKMFDSVESNAESGGRRLCADNDTSFSLLVAAGQSAQQCLPGEKEKRQGGQARWALQTEMGPQAMLGREAICTYEHL